MPAPSGWYEDAPGRQRWWDGTKWTDQYNYAVTTKKDPSAAKDEKKEKKKESAGAAGEHSDAELQRYVVLQVVLKEKLWTTGSRNLASLEEVINRQAALGYRLHTITTASSGSKGVGGGDRIQATMVFERIG